MRDKSELNYAVFTNCLHVPPLFGTSNSVQPRIRLNQLWTPTPARPPFASRPSTWIGAFVVVGAGLGLYAFAGGKTSGNSTPIVRLEVHSSKDYVNQTASENSKIITLAVPSHLMPDESTLGQCSRYTSKTPIYKSNDRIHH
ncbi:oxidoreductase FAD/NAD(P)-binding protein [Rhizoctonia solani]|uniref:Oxidoreductase FAD/NAD(P)-binding protein n=1 Tax=Rhizoctonia solani TaxID=456999 RepID=A0A8H8SS19_9AGAM|nr:oxidoreductase FAD/NAD(P)-binding protein [Rhizoctonia solani]QRW16134.1 oxidoreductase FAD/NAD(P)-binding protein [Rhizoctonia solani]